MTSSTAPDWQLSLHADISDIDRQWWQAGVGAYPFLQYDFLLALQEGNCLREFGWHPAFALLHQDKRPMAAMPLYVKNNTFGEFVFDGAWAQASERAGIDYYPKLVNAIPYTPATGPRWRSDSDDATRVLLQALPQVVEQLDCSSLHCLFPDDSADQLLDEQALLSRHDIQFHWYNRGYSDFTDFLAACRRKKAKNIRQERQRVQQQGFHFLWRRGSDMDEAEIELAHQHYASIYRRKWGYPALSAAFFKQIARAPADSLRVCFACHGSDALEHRLAASILFEAENTLYGRYWGCAEEYDGLHFECCYYQGIEYCIRNNIRLFEPGAQGEHKIARGFVPTLVRSRHYLRHPGLHQAIARHLAHERRMVADALRDYQQHSPYRD